MNMRWQLVAEPDPRRIETFSRELNISPVIARLLLNRGIEDLEAGQIFLNPRLEFLHDPFLFKEMEPAVERIVKALKRKEPIMIFGDYDVDGITATSLLYLVLYQAPVTINLITERGIFTAGLEAIATFMSKGCPCPLAHKITLKFRKHRKE